MGRPDPVFNGMVGEIHMSKVASEDVQQAERVDELTTSQALCGQILRVMGDSLEFARCGECLKAIGDELDFIYNLSKLLAEYGPPEQVHKVKG